MPNNFILISSEELALLVRQSCKEAFNELQTNATSIKSDDWGSRKEAAELLHVSLPTLHAMMTDGKIEFRKIGERRTLVNLSKIRRDVEAGRLGKYQHSTRE